MLHRSAPYSFGGQLRSERSTFARSLKPDIARRGPSQSIALLIGDGDDRIVKRRLYVDYAISNIFTDAPFGTTTPEAGLVPAALLAADLALEDFATISYLSST